MSFRKWGKFRRTRWYETDYDNIDISEYVKEGDDDIADYKMRMIITAAKMMIKKQFHQKQKRVLLKPCLISLFY
jgi:hypothetical protein